MINFLPLKGFEHKRHVKFSPYVFPIILTVGMLSIIAFLAGIGDMALWVLGAMFGGAVMNLRHRIRGE